MTKDIELKVHGIDFIVTVEYEDNAVCGVDNVRLKGSEKPLKCDITLFYAELDGFLQEALENAIADEKIAYYENLMDSKKDGE